MTRPIVLLDTDGVLADFVQVFLDFLKTRPAYRDHTWTHEHVTQFDICKALGLPGQVWSDFVRWLNGPGRLSLFPVLEGAHEGVKRLQEVAEVYVVTSPLSGVPTWAAERDHWLESRLGIPTSRVIHTAAKHLIFGDILVDDRIDNVAAWQKAWPQSRGLLWDAPWNRSDAVQFRVKSWDDVLRCGALRPVVEEAA